MAIRIIDPKVLKAILEAPYHRKMVQLALWYAWRYNNPIISSGYRTQKVWEGDSGIHMTVPCRALDWSIEGVANPDLVVKDVNNHFEYDPTRPGMQCALYHDVGLGPHIHTQVHDLTIFYKEGKEVSDDPS